MRPPFDCNTRIQRTVNSILTSLPGPPNLLVVRWALQNLSANVSSYYASTVWDHAILSIICKPSIKLKIRAPLVNIKTLFALKSKQKKIVIETHPINFFLMPLFPYCCCCQQFTGHPHQILKLVYLDNWSSCCLYRFTLANTRNQKYNLNACKQPPLKYVSQFWCTSLYTTFRYHT